MGRPAPPLGLESFRISDVLCLAVIFRPSAGSQSELGVMQMDMHDWGPEAPQVHRALQTKMKMQFIQAVSEP